MPRSVVVIGLGNDLRGDDAAGLEVVRRLVDEPGIAVRLHGGEAIDLLELWRGADAAVLVDTVRSGAAPGTVHRFDASAEPLASPLRRASSHTIGVGEAIELGRTLGGLPDRVVVYGVEGGRFEAGSELGEEVSGAIDGLARAVLAEARAIAAGGAAGQER